MSDPHSRFEIIPVSVVIPTAGRIVALRQTLATLRSQTVLPFEVIIIDGTATIESNEFIRSFVAELEFPSIRVFSAETRGAAPQRNQGIKLTSTANVLLLDDDILLDKDCLVTMWRALMLRPAAQGVTPIYVGDSYSPPGFFGRIIMSILNGHRLSSYAGRVLGPGFTCVPDDSVDLPEVVEIDWMGAGCALYRRDMLPDPPFPSVFQGASLFEDLCLSLTVAKKGSLLNARLARAIHAHEGGDHKKGRFRLAKMELVNRYYIMSRVLERRSVLDHLKFYLMMVYMTSGAFWSPTKWIELPSHLLGQLAGVLSLLIYGLPEKPHSDNA